MPSERIDNTIGVVGPNIGVVPEGHAHHAIRSRSAEPPTEDRNMRYSLEEDVETLIHTTHGLGYILQQLEGLPTNGQHQDRGPGAVHERDVHVTPGIRASPLGLQGPACTTHTGVRHRHGSSAYSAGSEMIDDVPLHPPLPPQRRYAAHCTHSCGRSSRARRPNTGRPDETARSARASTSPRESPAPGPGPLCPARRRLDGEATHCESGVSVGMSGQLSCRDARAGRMLWIMYMARHLTRDVGGAHVRPLGPGGGELHNTASSQCQETIRTSERFPLMSSGRHARVPLPRVLTELERPVPPVAAEVGGAAAPLLASVEASGTY
jgi:hypothetical protein